MVVLRGGQFLMGEVPLYPCTDSYDDPRTSCTWRVDPPAPLTARTATDPAGPIMA
eukprot:CAMPEP_0180238086 /NCGR_PEP_ID=MMETSP0987-20121128/30724_1 /TAXON_ID=697907 /ORGANISM="non described non described, Strain CCMP2293" /LENGTH=54 /DNA_ID=CAMNT_0022204553 /DNA_START=16 /DNA_END=176 /DNA_ORIENTATION=-